MYQDIAEASAIIVASPIYFYQVTGQTKVWLDRMFPMMDGNFAPRQPAKKAVTIFSQYQDDPTSFKSGMDWLNNILKNGFGWNLTASIACCGEPEEDSAEYKGLLKLAHAAGVALGKD
jgi:multimeric flavodoxin WrbA